MFNLFYSYDKYGSLGRKESMGRYRKYQPSSSASAVGMSMGSPRLVARNMNFQVSNFVEPVDTSPSYANMQFCAKSSPIMGRRAMGPPHHQRQTSELHNLSKQEVVADLEFIGLLAF